MSKRKVRKLHARACRWFNTGRNDRQYHGAHDKASRAPGIPTPERIAYLAGLESKTYCGDRLPIDVWVRVLAEAQR